MTNGAAIGYMIRAAKQAELDDELIKTLEIFMSNQMEFCSEEKAEETYNNF